MRCCPTGVTPVKYLHLVSWFFLNFFLWVICRPICYITSCHLLIAQFISPYHQAVTDIPKQTLSWWIILQMMPLVQWKPAHQKAQCALCFILWSIFFFAAWADRRHNLPSHMDCSMSSWSWWECWLCIWLFPWWSKWQKAALGSPTVSRHGVCLLHLLCFFFFLQCTRWCTAASHSNPKCHLGRESVFICEVGFAFFHGGGISGQAFAVAPQLPSSSRCTVLKGIEQWDRCGRW